MLSRLQPWGESHPSCNHSDVLSGLSIQDSSIHFLKEVSPNTRQTQGLNQLSAQFSGLEDLSQSWMFHHVAGRRVSPLISATQEAKTLFLPTNFVPDLHKCPFSFFLSGCPIIISYQNNERFFFRWHQPLCDAKRQCPLHCWRSCMWSCGGSCPKIGAELRSNP